MTPHVLVLSTADWDAPLWTNKQHLASRLAEHVPVTYVESLGLRRPTLRLDDVARIGRRLRRSSIRSTREPPTHAVDPGPEVVSPLVIPWHSGPAGVRAFNRRRLRAAVETWLGSPAQARVLWTFTSVTYGLEEDAACTIYHCVDLLEDFPGVDARAIREGERSLASRPDVVAIASSEPIADHLVARGFDAPRVWENVADVDRFARASEGVTRVPGRVVFAGNLSAHKVDTELLRAVAQTPGVKLHLAGPVADGGGPAPDLSWVPATGTVLHGPLDLDGLAALLATATVGVIPYLINDYTRGVYPMKVHEYQAAGLSVVSTPLPALVASDTASGVTLAPPDIFAQRVEELLEHDPERAQRQRAAARERSWERRTEQALQLLDDHVGRP